MFVSMRKREGEQGPSESRPVSAIESPVSGNYAVDIPGRG